MPLNPQGGLDGIRNSCNSIAERCLASLQKGGSLSPRSGGRQATTLPAGKRGVAATAPEDEATSRHVLHI